MDQLFPACRSKATTCLSSSIAGHRGRGDRVETHRNLEFRFWPFGDWTPCYPGPFPHIPFAAIPMMPLSGCNVARLTINTPLTPKQCLHYRGADDADRCRETNWARPTSITDAEGGAVVTYRFLNAKYARVNFGWLVKPWSPVDPDLVSLAPAWARTRFELLCDSNWVVTHQAFVRHRPDPLFTPHPF